MTDRYAVIGNPIVQSKSPIIHAAFAKATSQDLTYEKIEAPTAPGQFVGTVNAFRAAGGRGINVTAPFKLDAFSFANEHSERAKLAGAVNAMKFDGDRVTAENFDGVGLVRDLEINLNTPLKGKRILILGAGGATRGALHPILERAPAFVFVANRTAQKAHDLVAQYSSNTSVTSGGFEDIAHQSFDVVLNATSASLTNAQLKISPSVYAPNALAYDLTYGKGLTPFLKHANAASVKRLADGVGMLVEQAAEAFYWWRGVRPDTQHTIALIAVPLV
jgi:shikimate dehydrogenase